MEEQELSNLIKTIKNCNSKSKLYHNLKLLRRIVNDKSQFTKVRELGGLRLILTLLPNKNTEIVDIILSIIGNCCTERECAREVVKYHGLRTLSDILRISKIDTIICRVFRILGNIAQFDNHASEICKYDIISISVKVLDKACNNENDKSEEDKNEKKGFSLDTEEMAVRALRLLWHNFSSRQSMIQDGVVRVVSMVLIKNTQKWLKKDEPESLNKRREKLLENVLKCLLLFSKWGTPECAQQMLANGLGFKSLVALIDLFPYPVVKCITNLSHVATSRSDLDISAAVKSIVDKMDYHLKKKPNRGCPTEISNAFCLFSRHPLNCIEVKRAGGLPLILEILKNCRSRHQEFQILHSLPGFLNDEASQEILVSTGIVKIIVSCLERNLKSKAPLTDSHPYVRCKPKRKDDRSHPSSAKKRKLMKEMKIDCKKESPKNEFMNVIQEIHDRMEYLSEQSILNRCMTPSDSESSPLSSPCCTPPRQFDEPDDDDDDSVNYSPICSDNEETDNNDEIVNKVTESFLTNQFHEESETECDREQTQIESFDVHEKAVIVMLIVLSRIIHIKPYPVDLRDERTVVVLLKYVRENKYFKDRVASILAKIVNNSDNCIPLLLSNSLRTLNTLTQTQHDDFCAVCIRMKETATDLLDDLSVITTSNKIRSILFEQLNNENFEMKKKFMLNIPYIVKLRSMLLTIMQDYGGLKLLLNEFVNDEIGRCHTLSSLNKLACAIDINNPCAEKYPDLSINFNNCYKFDSTGKNVIVIKLDDGQTVQADRDFLIENVDYFKAMLTGSFKEADQDCVTLSNVSYNALTSLLFLLNLDTKTIKPCPLKIDLNVLLEVIVLTDSYLLQNYTEWLTSCVEFYMINVNSACDIYKWSIESGTNILRVETVAYLLTGKMKDCERLQLCENILENHYLNQLQDDFQNLLWRYLKLDLKK